MRSSQGRIYSPWEVIESKWMDDSLWTVQWNYYLFCIAFLFLFSIFLFLFLIPFLAFSALWCHSEKSKNQSETEWFGKDKNKPLLEVQEMAKYHNPYWYLAWLTKERLVPCIVWVPECAPCSFVQYSPDKMQLQEGKGDTDPALNRSQYCAHHWCLKARHTIAAAWQSSWNIKCW